MRTFVLARVTVKNLKQLPGMAECQMPADSDLLHSNIYSTAEAVLLAWVTAHFFKVGAIMLDLWLLHVVERNA